MNKPAYGVLISVLLWMLLLFFAVIFAVADVHGSRNVCPSTIFYALRWRSGFYAFLFLYQLALALFIVNAFFEEEVLSRRRVLGALWGISYLVMLSNICVINFVPILPMLILTPLFCLICGIYLLARGHHFSGILACSFSLCTWLVPILIELGHYTCC